MEMAEIPTAILYLKGQAAEAKVERRIVCRLIYTSQCIECPETDVTYIFRWSVDHAHTYLLALPYPL